MTAFAWSEGWFHPLESFWSIACKIAHGNETTVRQVVRYLGRVLVRHRESLLFPSVQTALAVCKELNLDSGQAAGSLFAAIGESQPLNLREHWRIGVRYCPRCLANLVHRTYFQDTRNERCKEHGDVLLQACPHCGRMLDPLGSAAWTCNFCRYSLCGPSSKWTEEFKRGAAMAGSAAQATRSTGALLAWSTPSGLGGHVVNRHLLTDCVYEEHAAFTHSLLGGHLECLEHDGNIEMAAVRPVQFRCPIAAAAIVTAGRLGICTQGVSGAWPEYRATISSSIALNQLEYLLSNTAVNQHPAVVRGAVRGWYVEALEVFARAARSGARSALWTPSAHVSWAPDILSKTEQLVSEAGRYCTIYSASPVRD